MEREGFIILLPQQMILGHQGKQILTKENKILFPGPTHSERSTFGHLRDQYLILRIK